MTPISEPDPPTVCALCREERALTDSHIIPEFMYKPAYDEKHRLAVVNAKTGRRPVIQKGLREPLLCSDCEGFLNTRYEQPFNRVWYESDLIPPLQPDEESILITGLDYTTFKLLHLSVLWRAGVARRAEFAPVRLGPHAETLREMLRRGEPGAPDEYPVFGVGVTMEGELAHGTVIPPSQLPFEGTRLYAMTYGGFEWYVGVGSHCPPKIRHLAFKTDGRLLALVRPLQETSAVQSIWKRHAAVREELAGG